MLAGLAAIAACDGAPMRNRGRGSRRDGGSDRRLQFLPLGDSLTEGFQAGAVYLGGYRAHLSSPTVPPIAPIGPYSDAWGNHDGAGGRRIAAVTSHVTAAIGSTYRPDLIALIIGTNDCAEIGGAYVGATAASDLAALLAEIDARAPSVRLIAMSSIPTMTGAYAAKAANVTDYNGRIGAVLDASAIHLAGRMTRIDVGAVCPVDLLGADGLHPSQAGYAAIGAAMVTAIAGAWA